MRFLEKAKWLWFNWWDYRKTKRIWMNWWSSNTSYVESTNSEKHINKSKMIISRYSSMLQGARSFCELGVGSGRNIHFFHKEFPEWKFRGNDISPDIHAIINSIYPDVSEYSAISIADTLGYLKICDHTDIMFTYGHLMHLPDAVIEEVCFLISAKTNKFLISHEAYPHLKGAKMRPSYKDYRFERDYENMFPGWRAIDKQIEDHPTRVGVRHCLYFWERGL